MSVSFQNSSHIASGDLLNDNGVKLLEDIFYNDFKWNKYFIISSKNKAATNCKCYIHEYSLSWQLYEIIKYALESTHWTGGSSVRCSNQLLYNNIIVNDRVVLNCSQSLTCLLYWFVNKCLMNRIFVLTVCSYRHTRIHNQQ